MFGRRPILIPALAVLVLSVAMAGADPFSAQTSAPSPASGSASQSLQAPAGGALSRSMVHEAVGTGCVPAWTAVDTPSPGSRDNFLHEVVTVGPDDVWAVGAAQIGEEPATVIEHWDGAAWTRVTSPNVGAGANYLYGVDAASASDIWAVGTFLNVGASRHRALILHYDGATWTTFPGPNVGSGNNYLQAVEVVSATDIWAVGYHEDDSGVVGTLILHYDGSAWSIFPSPEPAPSGNYLYGLSAIAPNDIWAVGAFYEASAGNLQTMTLHYDGSAWSSVPSPNQVASTPNLLMDVVATSASVAWAVGFANGTEDFEPFILEWDGTQWSLAGSSIRAGRFWGVDAVSRNDVWAVGGAGLIQHWDGTAWQEITVPSTLTGTLFGVSALPTGEVHAVGYNTPQGRKEKTLAGNLCEAAVTDTGFSIDQATVALGATVAWTFPEANLNNHRVVDRQRMGLFDSGPRPAGSSYTFAFLGAGSYTARDPISGDQLQLKIAPTVNPLQGSETTQFTVTWATGVVTGFVFDVQVNRPGPASWEDWKTGVTTLSAKFTPDAGTGEYSFRARVRNLTNGKASAYSPAVTITVT
jgi:plastocyanin